MAMKIRLARGGTKKRPHYSIVATDSRMPRDGRFLEKLGTYDPLLAKDDEARLKMNLERVKHWLSLGAARLWVLFRRHPGWGFRGPRRRHPSRWLAGTRAWLAYL